MKTWTKDEIKNLILTNDKMVIRSAKIMYGMQTDSEKASHETHVLNGIGLNAYDAPFISSCVEFYCRTGFMTAKQIASCRKKLVKYTGQLTTVANNLNNRG